MSEYHLLELDNSQVRRQDRLLHAERATQLLATAEWGVLSMCDNDGQPYGIPINFVWDGNRSIYIHCAPAGRKLQCVDHCSRVSFCVVGHVHLLPAHFTTEYESVVLQCQAERGLDDEERQHAVGLLLDKLSPDHKAAGIKAAAASMHRLEVLRLDILSVSAKCKQVTTPHAT